jgi:hypothetical protein
MYLIAEDIKFTYDVVSSFNKNGISVLKNYQDQLKE